MDGAARGGREAKAIRSLTCTARHAPERRRTPHIGRNPSRHARPCGKAGSPPRDPRQGRATIDLWSPSNHPRTPASQQSRSAPHSARSERCSPALAPGSPRPPESESKQYTLSSSLKQERVASEGSVSHETDEESPDQLEAYYQPRFDLWDKDLPVKDRREMFNKDLRRRKLSQSEQIQKIELERLKYNTFLSIKHDILKEVKEKKLDALIAILRKRKFTRIFVCS